MPSDVVLRALAGTSLLVAGMLAAPWLAPRLHPAPSRRVPVVVAVHSLSRGDVVRPEDVRVELRDGAAADGATSASSVVGHPLAHYLMAGDAVRLQDVRRIAADFVVPDGEVAFSVPASCPANVVYAQGPVYTPSDPPATAKILAFDGDVVWLAGSPAAASAFRALPPTSIEYTMRVDAEVTARTVGGCFTTHGDPAPAGDLWR